MMQLMCLALSQHVPPNTNPINQVSRSPHQENPDSPPSQNQAIGSHPYKKEMLARIDRFSSKKVV